MWIHSIRIPSPYVNVVSKVNKFMHHLPKWDIRATKILGLVHSNISRPLQINTHFSCKYFLTFIDDFSRYTFVYLIKHRVFDKLLQYKEFVECQTNHKIKILRSNNNGKYKSNEFNVHCLKFGIKGKFTTPYTPQQNGVFEHKNKNITWCFLIQSFLGGSIINNQLSSKPKSN